MVYILSLDILYSVGLVGQGSFDRGRSLSHQVEFAYQRIAVEAKHALSEADQLNAFSGQGPSHLPAASVELELSGRLQPLHLSALGILPRGGSWVIAPPAWLPHAGRGLHGQRFVRTQMVVLMAEVVEPALAQRHLRKTAPPAGHLPGAGEAFHLALGLRMGDAGDEQPHSLLHQPHPGPR